MPAKVDRTVRTREILSTAKFLGFGLLGAALVLGIFQYRAKSGATTTSDRWIAARSESLDGKEMLRASDLAGYIKGGPTVADTDLPGSGADGAAVGGKLRTYTWHGVFRSYMVTVYLGDGDDPPVDKIEFLGEVTAAPESEE